MKGILKRLEKSLERVIETPFAKVFRSGVHPLEVGRRILRILEDSKVLGVNEEVIAPNRFRCLLSREDHERLAPYLFAVSSQLESTIIEYCREKGYTLPCRPTVSFVVSKDLEEGEFEVEASLGGEKEVLYTGVDRRGAPSGSGTGIEAKRAREGTGLFWVEIGGGEHRLPYRLVSERTTLGRAADNDLVISDPKVSRHHAEVVRSPEGFVLRDLGSTNGTFVNGRKVSERLLVPGDTIVLGDTRLTFQLEEDIDQNKGQGR